MIFRRVYNILMLVGLALALESCTFEREIPDPAPVRVLLVYVGTDNNLSGLEQAKLQGLRDGWTGKATDHIVAYIDDRGGDARLIEISNLAPGESPRRIATYGTENSASTQTLSRVITDVIGLYPADSYGLLVFSHASGWLPQGTYNEFSAGRIPESAVTPPGAGAVSRSVIIDGSSEMELRDFAAAIPSGVFDYITFEACFMAGIEVAWELRHKAPYILASSAEIVDPGFAPVYSTSTPRLLDGNVQAFGQSVFNHTLTYAESNPQRSATYSVINTAGLDALAAFVKANCDFSKEVDITDVQRFDRLSVCTIFFDFGDYFSKLVDTQEQRDELARLVADCVDWKAATGEFMTQQTGYNGFTIAKHSGLTAYIPQEHLPGLNAAYANLQWTQAIN